MKKLVIIKIIFRNNIINKQKKYRESSSAIAILNTTNFSNKKNLLVPKFPFEFKQKIKKQLVLVIFAQTQINLHVNFTQKHTAALQKRRTQFPKPKFQKIVSILKFNHKTLIFLYGNITPNNLYYVWTNKGYLDTNFYG
eukprot:TRINITY_DN5116_c0_g1_i7.p5 TRINITY_DN5116_c0_g1~~TRINITY_DN5116_c0_g1_i7.p5  ORF type:complete len:139 (+),score=0.25 TRINITY_DN5116_c0_g1_i7:573-989(+)